MSTATAARRAAKNPWAERLGRAGWLTRAGLYAITAILVAQVARRGGHSGSRADQKGAVEALAHRPFGSVLLVAMAVGLVAFAAGRLAELLTSDDHGAKRWAKGTGMVCSAIGQLFLAAVAARMVVSHRQPSGGKEKGETAAVLSWPGGRVIVIIAGLVLIGTAVGFCVQAVRRKFLGHLDRSKMSKREMTAAAWIGTAGLAARGMIYGLVGLFLLDAAKRYDPNRAEGFDGALRRLASRSWGPAILFLMAAGLVAFALYCAFMARYREIGD